MNPVDIESIVKKYNHNSGGLIGMLNDIQALYSYLPEEALNLLSDQTGYSLVDIVGVVAFYKSFSLEPRGKHLCSVCSGTACHVRGAPKVAEEFEKQLNIKPGKTTDDREFSLESVNCLGACALGPIVVSDGHYFSNVKTPMVAKIIDETRSGLNKVQVETDARIFPVEVSCASCNHNLMDPGFLIDGYPSIKVTISSGQKHGWLRLSSLYGSHRIEIEFEIPENEIMQFFCPHCHAELTTASVCGDCDSPLVPMIIRGGGIVQICSRKGCNWHLLDLAL